MLVEQTIKTLYQGVSRQPDPVRLSGQVEEATNVLMSVVTGGFESRPCSRHLASTTFISGASDKPFIYSYARDSSEKYIIIIKNGDMKVFDTDGVEKTVSFPDGKTYLNATDPSISFSAVTIADRTIIANNQTTVSMVTSTYAESPFKALINCRTTNASTDYVIKVDGSTVYAMATAKSATALADDIISTFTTSPISGVTVTRDDQTIILEKSTSFTIEVTGSDDQFGPVGIRQSVPRRILLPLKAPDGYLVKVGATVDGQQSGYWVKFSAADGGWVETADPTADNAFTDTTMPHWLNRNADGTFTFSKGTYPSRITGDATTSPVPGFVGSKIQDVKFHRNRLAVIAGETISFSQSGLYFTFWADFSTQSLDSDGFTLTTSAAEVNLLGHAHPFRQSLFLTSDKNQFEVSGGTTLTPERATVDLATSYLAETNCRPFGLGNTLYFAAKSGKDAVLYEYQYQDDTLSNRAGDITLHALGYVPAPVVQISGDPANDMLFLLSSKDRSKIYVYRMYLDGEKKAQSAWFCWDFGGADTHIHWCYVIEGELHLFITRGTETFFEKVTLRYELSDDKHPYQIILDQQKALTGVFDSGTNLTTWTTPYLHGSAAVVILSTDFPAGQVGERLTVLYPTTTTITASGDFSGGQAIVGTPVTSSVQLSKLFVREADQANVTITTGRFQLKRIQVNFQETGFFNLKVTPAFRDEQVFTFNGRVVGAGENLIGSAAIADSGDFAVPIQTEASTAKIIIENNTEKPMTITSIDYAGFFNELSRAES